MAFKSFIFKDEKGKILSILNKDKIAFFLRVIDLSLEIIVKTLLIIIEEISVLNT